MLQNSYRKFGKRVFDIGLSVAFLLLFFWLYLLIIVAQLIFNKGEVFYLSFRPGKNGKRFLFYKFATMNEKKDADGELLPEIDRVTFLGKYLRKMSLDELPQILNIIKGDMSWVGPRPLLEEYLPLYNDYQKRRHEVLPGLTGWAQVNGRNQDTWEERFKKDVFYVDNLNFSLDLQIFLKTIKIVLQKKGVNYDSTISRYRFKGNKVD